MQEFFEFDIETVKCKCTEWVMCDYCSEKKEEETECKCTVLGTCNVCKEKEAPWLAEYQEYMNEIETENCKYCNGNKSLCNCYSCKCYCRQNSRIFFEILKNGLGLNKKTDFTYKDIIEKYNLGKYSGFKEYIEKNVGIENIKILYYNSLGCTNCCKRHQYDKPRPLNPEDFCRIIIQDSDSEEEN